jgi:hypothetical protein
LTLRYRLPEGARLPETVEIGGLDGVTVIDQHVSPEEIRVQILVDRLYRLQTGPLHLFYLDRDDNRRALEADPAALNINSNLGENPEKATLQPIEDILPVRSPWRRYAVWTVVAGSLFFVGTLCFWWYRRRKRLEVRADLMEPPHLTARKEIEALVAEGLFEKGAVKAFYFSLSLLMRRYLEAIRCIPAAELTTDEIYARVRTEADLNLVRLLRHADMVKFSDTMPTPQRKEIDVRTALSYIEETTPPGNIGPQDDAAQRKP